MLDTLIRNARIVDGTGRPSEVGSVGIRNGRVVAPGTMRRACAETIDATGLVVAPGFIDIHTHYDAQVFWDPRSSPSSLHGVTTAFGGNCGFTIAPIDRRARRLPHAHAGPGRGHAARVAAAGRAVGTWRTYRE